MNNAPHSENREPIGPWIGAAIVLLAAFAAYLPALRGGFIWDDTVSLTENQLIPRRDGLFYFWFTSIPQDYFPLTFTSFFIEYRLWGLNPMGYHFTNILLHGVGSVLLWRVLRQLRLPGAFLGALVFALHPVCVASVAWIAERKNTLSMVFYMLSLLFYLRFDESSNPEPGRRGAKPGGPRPLPEMGDSKFYWLSLTSFLLALLAKTSVVVLPAVLLLYAWWKRGRVTRREVLRSIPFFILSFALSVMTVWFQVHRAMGGEETVVQLENFWQRLAAAGWALWFYIYKALVPIQLNAVYPRWDLTTATVWAYVPLLLFLGVLWLGWWFRAGWGRHVLFGLGYFALTLLPVLGFIDMFYLTYSRVADHWAYVSLPAIIALLVGGGSALARGHWGWNKGIKGRLAIVVCVCVVGSLAFLTLRRAGVYASELTLWGDAVKKNPAAASAHNNLGLAYLKQGRYEEAQHSFGEALRLNPAHPEALNNMGYLLDRLGRHEDAAGYYERAVKAAPRFAQAINNWGVNLMDRGKTEEGEAQLRAALKLNPNHAAAHENLAVHLMKKGAAEEALPHALQALELDRDNPDAYYIAGNSWFLRGDIRQAVENFSTACRMRPSFADAQHNLAVALTKLGLSKEADAHFAQEVALRPNDPNVKLQQGIILAQSGQLQQAAEQFRKAVSLQPQDAESHNRLGFILAKQGKTDQALAEFKQALRLDPKSADAHKNFGNALLESGQPQQALSEFEEARRLRPADAVLQAQSGMALVALGKDDDAKRRFEEALRQEPENYTAHYGMGNLLLKQGQLAEARDHYLLTLQARPDFAEAHYQLGMIFQSQQDFKEGRSHLQEAVRLKPDWPEALNNLAWLLATQKDPQLRDGPEAVRLAEHAVQLRQSKDVEQLDTLAAAYAEAGRFAEALRTVQRALTMAEAGGKAKLADTLRSRLPLYSAGKPYHEP